MGNHRFIDTFLIGQLLEQCSGIPPPWLVVNSWLTVSAYLIILNVLNNSIVTLFHFLLFLRYALRNLPGMRQLRGYNQRKNEGKMKAGTSETSGEFSLLEWQRTDLVLKEQVPGQACTRNKKCYLYEVYVELRYTSFTETYQFGVTIFCNTPWIKVGNTTNVKSYLIDRIRPVDLVLLQNLFSACSPPGSYRMRVGFPGGGVTMRVSRRFYGSSKMVDYVSLSFEQNGSSMVRNLKL